MGRSRKDNDASKEEVNDSESDSEQVTKKRSSSQDQVENEEEPSTKKSKTDEDVDKNDTKKRSPDLAKFWKAVEDDPQDFTGWTCEYRFFCYVNVNSGLSFPTFCSFFSVS